MKDSEYKLLADLIYQKTGIDLGDKKKELLKTRLMKRLKALNCRSYRQYYDYLLEDETGSEITRMIDVVTTNTTFFFREKNHFKILCDTVLPDIIGRKREKGSSKLRVWSAACSSGEEVYSLAMIMLDYLKDFAGWDVKILGTDISTRQLVLAQKGEYNAEQVREIPLRYLQSYFDKRTEETKKTYVIKNYVKKAVVFRWFNLMSGTYPFTSKLDLIFCRNVMIYFDRQTQKILLDKLYDYLDYGGYLFVGHAESLAGMKTMFRSIAPAVFRKD